MIMFVHQLVQPESAPKFMKIYSKIGCTVMVGMEFFPSEMLPPFIVLTAKHEGTLAKEWNQYAGPARMCFQPKHWMDGPTARKVLDWLASLYPGKKIGIIWDYAGAYIDAGVLEYAKTLGIVVEFINKGMTLHSAALRFVQVWANQPLKRYVKEEYYKYRISLNLADQREVKVPHETFVKWVEEGIQSLSKLQHNTRAVAKTFSKCGLDPHDDKQVLFDNHLITIQFESCVLFNVVVD